LLDAGLKKQVSNIQNLVSSVLPPAFFLPRDVMSYFLLIDLKEVNGAKGRFLPETEKQGKRMGSRRGKRKQCTKIYFDGT